MKLEDTKRRGYAYSRALANEYENLAKSEKSEYGDEIDASHFAVKGIQAASGLEVLPEDPENWENIYNTQDMTELMKARERLIFALYKSGTIIDPMNAAKAVTLYDCWVEEVSEGTTEYTGHKWQDPQIYKCKHGFYKTLRLLEGNVRAKAPTFMLWFDLHKSQIDRKGHEEIDQVTKVLKHLRNHKILIHCSGDRTGGRAYNLKLSQRRAMAVKGELIKSGVPVTRIEAAVGLGEKGKKMIDPFHRRCDIHLR